jgi:hypothetical protein
MCEVGHGSRENEERGKDQSLRTSRSRDYEDAGYESDKNSEGSEILADCHAANREVCGYLTPIQWEFQFQICS